MPDFSIQEISKKCVAIVKFGPVTECDGFRPAEYYQVTIDPDKVSKSGDFIRMGTFGGDEIVGWQRCKALSIVEILGEYDGDSSPVMSYGKGLTMMVLEREDGANHNAGVGSASNG